MLVNLFSFVHKTCKKKSKSYIPWYKGLPNKLVQELKDILSNKLKKQLGKINFWEAHLSSPDSKIWTAT